MSANTFGKLFCVTTFGESHGVALGGIIDGCPAGLEIDLAFIQSELERRKPGQSKITTQRQEADEVKFLSGIFEGKTTGTPIGFIIENQDQKSKDYDYLKENFRPSHADYTYDVKYGIRDHRGGGRSSARETVSRTVAGAIAKLFLLKNNIIVNAYVSQVGKIVCDSDYKNLDFSKTENNMVRCPDEKMAEIMIAYIEDIKKQGDTIGGTVSCVIQGLPVGIGEPVFDKLHADLGKAMLSINAAKGFDYGSGFDDMEKKGSELNDAFEMVDNKVSTKTNHSGGIQGGISNGEAIYFRVVFKPVATILKTQKSINKEGENIDIQNRGRHDPCVLPRAVPIVESMAALVIADHLLRQKTNKI
jgi:chorismate synthase